MVRNAHAHAYATSRTCYAFRVLERAERRGTLWPRGSDDSVAARGQERARGSITLMERSSTCGSTLGQVGREVDCDIVPGTLEQFQVLQVLTCGVQTSGMSRTRRRVTTHKQYQFTSERVQRRCRASSSRTSATAALIPHRIVTPHCHNKSMKASGPVGFPGLRLPSFRFLRQDDFDHPPRSRRSHCSATSSFFSPWFSRRYLIRIL